MVLKNVRATVIYSLDAPLLLGQSVLERLGRIQVDYASRTITVFDGGTRQYDYSSNSVNSIASMPERIAKKYSYTTTLKDGFNNISLYEEPNTLSQTFIHVPRYHEINVISEYNNVFYRVRVNGEIGYMEKRYIKK
ncbi:hypothetical protein KAJ27_22585 [bacterium]|nr:hypothetical protein [bacterium]